MKTRIALPRAARGLSGPWLLAVSGLALPGCGTQRAWYAGPAAGPGAVEAPMASPPPATVPVAPQLSLFGEEDWAPPEDVPVHPLPRNANPDSVDAARVTFAAEGADFDPSISADGRFIAFASTQHHHNADIYLKAVGSSILTQLTSDPARDVMPAISPDGEWIAYASDRTLDWNIYVMPRAGGRPVQITSEGAAELHPSWSPDGSRLAYSKLGQTSGRWEIWITEAANTSTPQFIGYGLFPEWCPKAGTGPNGGDLILFQRSAERGDRAFGIWCLEMKDGNVSSPSQLMANPTTAYINPTWSPDGRHIVFASVSDPHSISNVTEIDEHDSDLWMMSADGSTMVSLTTGASSDLLPAWGNDGRIYFVSTRTGRDNIWAISASDAMLAAGLNPSETPSEPVASAPTDQ